MRGGEVAKSVALKISDPLATELAARAGFDCIWIDAEHTPTTLRQIEHIVRAAKIYDTDVIVRVQRGSYSDLIHPLEMDATAIMVPHLMGVKEAKEIAWYTKFHPIGRRPLDGGNSDGAYCQIPLEDYLRQANEQRFVAVQIEDPEPMEEIEEIAAVDGMDMLFFGPGDFSHGLGVPGQMDDPRIEEARRRIPVVAHRFGRFAGTVGTPDTYKSLVEMGYDFVNVGADVLGLAKFFSDVYAALE
jgi:4-hydroxy-2-oxoheptanedioate aldolase